MKLPSPSIKPIVVVLGLAFATGAAAQNNTLTMTPVAKAAQVMPNSGSSIAPAMELIVGKSTLIRLSKPIQRISVGNPAVADVTLINNRELYLLGKGFGSTNVMLWRKGGGTTIIDVTVSADATALEQRIRTLMPSEQNIAVSAAADSLVLSGSVSSISAADSAMQIAQSFIAAYSRSLKVEGNGGDQKISQDQIRGNGDGPRVVNLMAIDQPQQVMLEVKVAEVSKSLLDRLGAGLNVDRSRGGWRYGIVSNLLSDSAGLLSAIKNADDLISIDAEQRNGLVKVLAEPNIVSISGKEASFLAGGKIFIPVARSSGALGVPTITLEEKEFGVGLKFTPTVLSNGRINLSVAPEVSELSQTGSPFTAVDGSTTILPSFTTRRAQTTVQLGDGQSFAIAGLIKNNVTSLVKRIPVLGEIPILGSLFRSTEFQNDRTELMFIITPRLVKPVTEDIAVPTDHYQAPTRTELMLNGMLEGSGGRKDLPADRPGTVPKTTEVITGPRADGLGDYFIN